MDARLDDEYGWEEAFAEPGTNMAPQAPEAQPPNCGVALTPFTREDVAEIIALDGGEPDGNDWIGVFRLSDGRFATVEGGCDYTGWD